MSIYQTDDAKRATKPPTARAVVIALLMAEPDTWHTPTGLERLRKASREPQYVSSAAMRTALQDLYAEGKVERADTGFNKYDRPKWKYRWIVEQEAA